jgi:broad specificity phosphatase PhoE
MRAGARASALGAVLAGTLLGAMAGCATPRAVEPAGAAHGVILLVRHAETAPDGTRDPTLSPEGERRAAELARLLADAGLDAVYSTDYARTRTTARAVADAVGLAVEPYDPRRLDEMAARLRQAGGTRLVVGHSNTTPALVSALGGEPGPPIHEDEHGRLYILYLEADRTRTVVLRYGPPDP